MELVKLTILNNKHCNISLTDNVLFKDLRYRLSYKMIGVEYTQAFKNGWDGITYLLDKKGNFPLGLIHRVEKFLSDNKINYEIVDKRKSVEIIDEINITDTLKSLKKEPRDYQLAMVEAAFNNRKGIIRAATGSGKCSDISSLHLTEYGLLDYKEIQAILNNDNMQINSAIACNIEVSTPLSSNQTDTSSYLYYDGYGKSIKITTLYGFTLTATSEHKIQVLNKNGCIEWKKFKDLNISDYTVISYDNNYFGKEQISLDTAFWYGLLLGDGSLTSKTQTKFTNMDKHLLKFADRYLRKNHLVYSIFQKENNKAVDISINNNIYRSKLYKFGFDYCKSIHKTLPLNIRKLDKKSLSMVLRGLYETDGWVENIGSKPAVCISLSTKKLIDQLHLILLNFGIISSRRLKKTTHEDSHILTIYREFIPKFIKEIGFDPKGRKYLSLKKAMKFCANKITNSNTNIIPYQNNKIKCLIKHYNNLYPAKIGEDKTSPFSWNTIRSWIGWRRPSKNNLLKFINWYENKLKNDNFLSKEISIVLDEIKYIINSKFFYAPIKKIENIYSHNYDFVIPKTHSFVSQGFVNHNSTGAALITAKLNKPTIIYVIGLDLLQQFHKLFSEIFQTPIGFIGNGVCDIQNINIASIWTVGKALDIKFKMFDEEDIQTDEQDPNIDNKLKIQELLKTTKVHIFDECHSVACDTVKEIFKNIDPEHIYGMSGTPYRDDGSDLLIHGMLGEQIINVSASDLIARGILAQPIIKFINVPAIPVRGRTYADVYSEYIVENDARNFLIVQETKKLIEKGYQTLVLFKQIKHGKILHKLFIENGIQCEMLHGSHKLEDREEVKQRLLNKQSNVILASIIFDTGVDLPTLSGLVLAGGGKSSTRCLQRIGRCIRAYPGKTYAAIVDFVDNARFLKKHSEARYKIYSSEKGFIVKYPKQKYM